MSFAVCLTNYLGHLPILNKPIDAKLLIVFLNLKLCGIEIKYTTSSFCTKTNDT